MPKSDDERVFDKLPARERDLLRATFVRSMPDATAEEVVEAGKRKGLRLTRKYVNDLRSSDRGWERKGRRPEGKQRRGFAAMNPTLARAISSMGGRAAHAQGTAHTFKSGKEARRAGAKGGRA